MGEVMLIQMSFIKKELLVAMGAIDELLKENHFNMQLMATVPAFMITFSLYFFSRRTYRYFTRKKQSRTVVRRIRFTMRDIERLLTLADSKLAQMKDNNSSSRVMNNRFMPGLLNRDLGQLVLLLHRLAKQIRESTTELQLEERDRVEEDLRDLINDQFTIEERIKTIQRMFRTYGIIFCIIITCFRKPKNY
jgi:hypothetical protein